MPSRAKNLTDEQVLQAARLLQGTHGAWSILANLWANRRKRVYNVWKRYKLKKKDQHVGSLGFSALTFVYLYEAVYIAHGGPQEMRDEVAAWHTQATLCTVLDHVDKFIVAGPDGKEDAHESVLRHLRNSFGHYNFSYNSLSGRVTLRDFATSGNPSFELEVSLSDLLEKAERLLIAAHGVTVAEAQSRGIL